MTVIRSFLTGLAATALVSSPAAFAKPGEASQGGKSSAPLTTYASSEKSEAKVPPGKCVSEIAKPHSGSGISDEVKEECGVGPTSK